MGDLEVEAIGSGEPVVVIQTALTADELRPLARRLALHGQHQVFHCHRRGYAGSAPALRPRSVTTDAADVAALIRTLAAAPAHVVGVSYSAAVGFALAASNPDLVQSLAAVEPPPCGTPHAPDFLEANRQLLKTHASMGPQAALEQFMATLVGSEWREVSERAMAGSVAAMERDAATFFGSDVPALLTWRFDADDAARIECPVLLINGSTSSPWFSEMRTRVLHLLPHAEDMAVAGAGHLLGSTHCDELAALLLEQLTRHPRSDRRAPSEHSRT